MTFDPRFPPITNSLNRLTLAGTAVPEKLRGKAGYELVSDAALAVLIQPFTSSVPAFYAQAEAGAEWATRIARALGERLGCLLAALARGDAQTRQANPEKPAGYWAHWAGIKTVFLGGGMARGSVGTLIAAQAEATARALTGNPGYQVTRAEHPQYLPLLGAARMVATGSRASILDFGGSFVKRATAHYTSAGLARLEIRDSLPNDLQNTADAAAIFETMTGIIAASHAEGDAPVIPISAATYVDQRGQPLPSQGGIYMRLAELTEDIPAALSEAVGDHAGHHVEVRLLHDGTAAALTYAPLGHAGVIMLGTAIGSGYPVARPGMPLRAFAPNFTVQE